MAKTKAEVAKRVLQKLGRLARGQAAFADDLKLAEDTYDAVYKMLQAPELLAPWPPAEDIPEEAYLPIVALVASMLTSEFRVTAEALAKIELDASQAKPQLRANAFEPWTSADDGPIEMEKL